MKRLMILAMAATFSTGAFAQTWKNFYEAGLDAAKAGNWSDARTDFLQASQAKPGDSPKGVSLGGSLVFRKMFRNGAPYSPDFLAAYSGLREALLMSGDARTGMLQQSAAEFENLINKREYCKETFFFLDETYVFLGATDKRVTLGHQYNNLASGMNWKIDAGGVAPDDEALVAELPDPAQPSKQTKSQPATANIKPVNPPQKTSDTTKAAAAKNGVQPPSPSGKSAVSQAYAWPSGVPHGVTNPAIYSPTQTSPSPIGPPATSPKAPAVLPAPTASKQNSGAPTTPQQSTSTPAAQKQATTAQPSSVQVPNAQSTNSANAVKSGPSQVQTKDTSTQPVLQPILIQPLTPLSNTQPAVQPTPSTAAPAPQTSAPAAQPSSTPPINKSKKHRKDKAASATTQPAKDQPTVSQPAANQPTAVSQPTVLVPGPVKPVSPKAAGHGTVAGKNPALIGAIPALPDKYALIIGNSESKIDGGSLPFAGDDAQLVRQSLIMDAGYMDENIEVVVNGTAAQMANTVNALASRVPDKATVFIYFTGVGENFDGKDYLAGVDSDSSGDSSTMISKDDIYKAFMLKGARIFAFYQANRPIIEGHYFGSECPLVGSIAQTQATIPGSSVFSINTNGKAEGLFTNSLVSVLHDMRSSSTPILDFGWAVFYHVRRGDTGQDGGSSNQSPSLPVLTNMASDARF